MTEATTLLRALAQRLADSYIARVHPRAVLLVGSAATGDADEYSDVDMIAYYERVPPADAIAETPGDVGAEGYRGTPSSDESGEPDESAYGERYFVDGIECQLAHVSVGSFEREITRLTSDLDLDEELLKIMSGLFEGLPLYGHELIDRWRREADYGEDLQRAVIEKCWKFFPWWYFQERLRSRDAMVWRYDVLAQSVYSIVGVLAALNRIYFSTFEFKRTSKFLARLDVAPPNLAPRVEALFGSAERRSTAELERLVAETQALVAERFPDLDVALEWAGRPTPPGSRETPWKRPGRRATPRDA